MRTRLAVLFLGMTLGAAVHGAAQTRFVNVELRPEKATVGGRVEARLVLVWDGSRPTAAPAFPDWEETKAWGRAEVLGYGPVETVSSRAGRYIYNQTVVLTAFETGEVALPPLTVTLRLPEEKTAEVPTREGVFFTVDSVLPEEAEALALDPRPAAALRELPSDALFLRTSAVLAVLCLAAAVLLARRLGQVKAAAIAAAAPPPVLEPLDELLKTLGEIDVRAGSEPVHTATSLALRRYLGRMLHFNATESTTSEIERRLAMGLLSEELSDGTVELLKDCDQVKYARLDVGEALVDERLAFLGDLAKEINHELRPPVLSPLDPPEGTSPEEAVLPPLDPPEGKEAR